MPLHLASLAFEHLFFEIQATHHVSKAQSREKRKGYNCVSCYMFGTVQLTTQYMPLPLILTIWF